jgi:carbamate kinase
VRIVVALGGNALLRRGEALSAANQRANVRVAAAALAPLAEQHELVVSHGNGPQVGLLALQQQAFPEVDAYPLDILGAQTEGMIGYLIEQELGNLLPFEKPLATVLTMTEVSPDDPAFDDPTKFVGPVYDEVTGTRMAAEKGWTVKPDGPYFRRVVPSPRPLRVFQVEPIETLISAGCIVICTGGGGIPTMYLPGTRILTGVEAVVDKDLASAVLARELHADLFVMATDGGGVFLDWGTPHARELAAVTTAELRRHTFAAGSMGPKVEAAIEFVEATGRAAAIGSLEDIERIVAGTAGTRILRDGIEPLTYRAPDEPLRPTG